MNKNFTHYAHVCSFLDELGLFHMDLSLERMYSALESLQLTKLPFFVVQVVGTNGKGSTVTFLESLARAHGIRTGLFTSPHFVSPKERIRIDGIALNEEHWPALAQKVHNAAPNLTYFEFLTVLSVLSFVECGVEFAIMEAGLGGHYDATTAVARDALGITPISMDHVQILGDSLIAIAADKAEAIAEHMPVFSAPQETSVLTLLQQICTQRHAAFSSDHAILQNYIQPDFLGLQGAHQVHNATLALALWQHATRINNWPLQKENIEKALKSAFIPGRMQHIYSQDNSLPAHILLDGAHNTQGLQSLIDYVSTLSIKPALIIFSCLADKDLAGLEVLLKKLHGLCAHCPLLITDIKNNQRALNATEKATLLLNKPQALSMDSIFDALSYARDYLKDSEQRKAPVLICGSLYLLGEFYTKYSQYLYK